MCLNGLCRRGTDENNKTFISSDNEIVVIGEFAFTSCRTLGVASEFLSSKNNVYVIVSVSIAGQFVIRCLAPIFLCALLFYSFLCFVSVFIFVVTLFGDLSFEAVGNN